jgi:hypothetical protein
MRLENRVVRLPPRRQGPWLAATAAAVSGELSEDAYPLRFALTSIAEGAGRLEMTLATGWRESGGPWPPAILAPRRKEYQAYPFAVVQVIPTGVRCELGGYAGDACPVTNLLAAAADLLVTHPNAVNASDLNEMAGNVLYVEGKSLDDFLLGHAGLLPVSANRIGTFVDPAGLAYLDEVTSCLDAARAVAGIDCGRYSVLRESLGIGIEWSETGCAVGTISRPEVVLETVATLIAQGAQAIGGLSVIHGVDGDMFRRHLAGELPNPSGGVEAILSHLISAVFRVPTAHAPLPYYKELKGHATRNPRAAAEFISTPHYMSVLKGLARAPRLVALRSLSRAPAQAITLDHVGAIVVPASCLGGIPSMAAEASGIPLIAVRENRTILDVTNASMGMENVIEVGSYLEAAGVVLALRRGLSLESLRRPLGPSLREVDAELADNRERAARAATVVP